MRYDLGLFLQGAQKNLGLFQWAGALRIAGSSWFLDSRFPRSRCFVSHAHSDHLPWSQWSEEAPDEPPPIHDVALCTPATAALAHARGGLARQVIERDYHEPLELERGLTATLLPAGHVLGSAMLHVQRGGESLLYTGDFKLRRCHTAQCAQPMRADVLVMESTFGTPHYRFPPANLVEEQLVELVGQAMREGQQPIVYGYSLGKVQEIIRILTGAGFVVTKHGAVARVSAIYEQFGVMLGRPEQLRRYRPEDFRGPTAIALEQRGVLVAPPDMARSGFTAQFGDDVCRIILTGWAMLKNARWRYGVDHALPLSDHADFDELLRMIELVQPRHVVTTHGPDEFADHLAARGIDATLARPPAQMRLF